MPVDPGRHWLEAGITGLARQREWDAVATTVAPGTAGDEAEFVALADERIVVEGGPDGFDPTPLVAALAGVIEAPYRAVALRRPELWAIGARSITVAELANDPGGDFVELVRDSAGLSVRVNGLAASRQVPELERLGSERYGSYVVRARRLDGSLFELEVEPL